MRLIQPTLLLLLLAIHGESCVLPPGSGKSQEDKKKEILMKCLAEKCPTEEAACKNKPDCMGNLDCMVKYCKDDQVVCHQDCGPDNVAQKLLQCSVNQECIPHTKDTCPGEPVQQNQKPDNQNLLQQMANKTWSALMTADPDAKHGFLNYPCTSLVLYWDGENFRLVYKNCYGNSTIGKCVTGYTTTIGNGKQIGNSEVVELDLAKKDFLLDRSKLRIHVYKLVKDKLAFLKFCLQDDTTVRTSEMMIFSTFTTYTSLLRDSKDPKNVTSQQLYDAMIELKDHSTYYYHMAREQCQK